MTTLDSRAVRNTVQGMSANFLLNGALSGTSYIISICYKATSGTASLYQFKGNGYGDYVSLGSLTVDGQWHTTLFATSAVDVYDYVLRGQTNIIFWINSASSVAVDSITVCRDGDGDGYSDALESIRITQSSVGTHVYDLNPFSADTDSDGLGDNVERTAAHMTDPCDPDTDSDGLLDGSEKYSYTWSTDDSYLIPDNGTVLDIAFSVPAIAGGSASITSFCLVLGIMHTSQYQLEVKVAKGTGTHKIVKAANTGSGANFFILRNLFTISSPYTASDLSSANVWHIYVRDVSTAGEKGRVEYARLQVNGTTNPLDSDSDDDLLLDGEEVEFGTDGWMTNPRSSDSDSDGVFDRNEIIGSTLCGSATDPTRADTDDDGYADNIDRYMGDAVLRITLMEYKTLDTINGQDNVPVFFVINYQDEEQEFATKRISATKNVLCALNWVYDVDIPETATYVNVEFEAVAENAGWLGDDAQLDIDQDDSNKYNAYWTISSTPFIGTGTDSGGSYDAYLKMKMERAVAEKAKVIVINVTGEDGDYGLDAVSTGVYRYSADDQVYLVVLNVSGTSAHFQSGMNTIILPRAIALQCQLNDTLYDLQNVGNTPLNGASFYSTDPLKSTASGHIIAVISKNVTASQAETILTMLTHNSTGGRIGNNVTISPTALYLLHLPNDILSAIPTSVMNSGMGEGPNYYSLGSIIGDIAGMVFDFMVWVATGGVLLLLAHLVKEGLKAIGNLASDLWDDVQDAVDRIVDAFWECVNYIIKLIKTAYESLIAEPLNNIRDSFVSWALGIISVIKNVSTSVEKGQMNVFQAAEEIFDFMFGSTTFKLLMAIATMIIIGMSLAQTITGPFGFVLLLISPVLIDIIMQGMVTGLTGAHWLIDSIINGVANISYSIFDFLTSEGVQLSATVVSVFAVLSSFFFGQISVFGDLGDDDLEIGKKIKSSISFLCSCIGLILFWIDIGDDQEDNDLLDYTGLFFTCIGLVAGLDGAKRTPVGKICIAFSSISLFTGLVDVMA